MCIVGANEVVDQEKENHRERLSFYFIKLRALPPPTTTAPTARSSQMWRESYQLLLKLGTVGAEQCTDTRLGEGGNAATPARCLAKIN